MEILPICLSCYRKITGRVWGRAPNYMHFTCFIVSNFKNLIYKCKLSVMKMYSFIIRTFIRR